LSGSRPHVGQEHFLADDFLAMLTFEGKYTDG
jgi:hypothetical protein